ncbi:MAG: hypothetical protein IT311_07085 [Anaerolineales bacterium]|nr:hypothetical protein [Anaerolineales bacterium]MCZ2123127.1 hypothetical protein [Anaerolineales bacterium]
MWKLNKIQTAFLALFLVSTFILFALPIVRFPSATMPQPTSAPSVIPTEEPNAPNQPSSNGSASQSVAAFVGSALASLISLVGFIVTTAITWRKEKRESALADLQQKKLQTELEKSKIELEALKKKEQKKKKK